MQKLLPIHDGLKAYQRSPDMLVTEETRRCPFCSDGHRLQLHGHYHRTVLVPGQDGTHRIPIRRFRCVRTGHTVSLLPDFCVPRRQHGPEILGEFLAAYSEGQPLLAALRAVRPDAPCHSVAQSLRRSFLARAGPIRAYVARRRARMLEPRRKSDGLRQEVAVLMAELCLGFANAARAFLHHGVGVHEMVGVGLA